MDRITTSLSTVRTKVKSDDPGWLHGQDRGVSWHLPQCGCMAEYQWCLALCWKTHFASWCWWAVCHSDPASQTLLRNGNISLLLSMFFRNPVWASTVVLSVCCGTLAFSHARHPWTRMVPWVFTLISRMICFLCFIMPIPTLKWTYVPIHNPLFDAKSTFLEN